MREKGISQCGQEKQDVITRGDPFDIQIRPVYTSRQKKSMHTLVCMHRA